MARSIAGLWPPLWLPHIMACELAMDTALPLPSELQERRLGAGSTAPELTSLSPADQARGTLATSLWWHDTPAPVPLQKEQAPLCWLAPRPMTQKVCG